MKNTGTEPNSLVAIFSAPGFEEYLRCRSVPASEKGTSISMEEIKGCAHEGHVTYEAFEKSPKNSLLWVAKTSTATKNETVLGREGLNTILASTQGEEFGGQEPVWAYSTHTY